MKQSLFALTAALALVACQPAAKAPEAPPAVTTEQSLAMAAKLTAEGGAFSGVLFSASDAGAPNYATSIVLDGGATLDLTLDTQAHPVEGGIDALVGKPVSGVVVMTAKNEILRLEAKGKTVFEPGTESGAPVVIPETAKTITGKLSGAKAPAGAFANTMTVTAADGTAVAFEAYADERLAAQEGKVVTMTFDVWNAPTLTALKAAPIQDGKK